MDLAKHWRLRASRYRLEGQRHRTSGEVRFPPEPHAGAEAQDWEPFALSGGGSGQVSLAEDASGRVSVAGRGRAR